MSKGLWVKVSANLIRHPKFQRFSTILDEPQVTSAGRLLLLWSYALEFYPSGELKITKKELASICEWQGDPEEFYQALISCGGKEGCGFIKDERGILVIHDWIDFSGKLNEKRTKARERMRRLREREKEEKLRENVTRTFAERTRTKENESEQKRTGRTGHETDPKKQENFQEQQNDQNVGMTDDFEGNSKDLKLREHSRTFALKNKNQNQKREGAIRASLAKNPPSSPSDEEPQSLAIVDPWTNNVMQEIAKTVKNPKPAKLPELIAKWRETYGETFTGAEIKKALLWLQENGRRYTDMGRFLGSWLMRSEKNQSRYQQPRSYRQQTTPDRGDLPPSWHDVMPNVAEALKLTD